MLTQVDLGSLFQILIIFLNDFFIWYFNIVLIEK
jgi:hypothetical protein